MPTVAMIYTILVGVSEENNHEEVLILCRRGFSPRSLDDKYPHLYTERKLQTDKTAQFIAVAFPNAF